jgi:hypothetical protein
MQDDICKKKKFNSDKKYSFKNYGEDLRMMISGHSKYVFLLMSLYS